MNWHVRYETVVEAIAALLGPEAEVVVHDLATDRIAQIVNPLSRRRVGDPSLLDLEAGDLAPGRAVLGPYEKAGPSGDRIRSVSAVLPGEDGRPAGLLCVNLGLGRFDAAARLLAGLFPPVAPRPEALFRRDWREAVNLILRDRLAAAGLSADRLDRAGRVALVAAIDAEGLLEMRHAAAYVASQLGISRATLYADRAAARSSTAA
jgi:predicted transcriptional regulator YheO